MWISLEQFKGFASGAYSRGADGIYLFNHFNTDDDCHSYKNLGLFTCYIDEKGNKIKKRVLKDNINCANSLETAETGMRTYVNTYAEKNCYPVKLTTGTNFEFRLNTGTKPQRFILVVGIDDCADFEPLRAWVNGVEMKNIEDVPREKGFVFKKEREPWTYIDHVSEAAFRVMQFEADIIAVKDGFNSFELMANADTTIRWIEIQVM